MFGSRDGVSARRVQHDDAAAGRCLDIDVIHSDTGAAHDTQFVTGIQNFGGDFGLAAHHQRAERRNQLDEFALVQAGLTVTCSAFSRASSSTPRCEMESAMRTFGGVTAVLRLVSKHRRNVHQT